MTSCENKLQYPAKLAVLLTGRRMSFSVQNMDYVELARNLISFFVILLFSLCFHEMAHGWVAKLRGDNTAETLGRLTMNPLAHMDPTGTLILPVITIVLNSMGSNLPLFGWAKPVPVNIRNLKHPRTDMFWIALAGPLSNIVLAILGTAFLVLASLSLVTTTYFQGISALLQQFILTNLFLAFFNILPVHPLDGGKVLARFLPASINQLLERNEQMTSIVLMILIMMGALQVLVYPVRWAYYLLLMAAQGIIS